LSVFFLYAWYINKYKHYFRDMITNSLIQRKVLRDIIMKLYLKGEICEDCADKIRIGTEALHVNGQYVHFVLWSCRLCQCRRIEKKITLFLVNSKHDLGTTRK